MLNPVTPGGTTRNATNTNTRRRGTIKITYLLIPFTFCLISIHSYFFWIHASTTEHPPTFDENDNAVDEGWVDQIMNDIHQEHHRQKILNHDNPSQSQPSKKKTSQTSKQMQMRKEYDVCIVGAGLSGSVLAERFATTLQKSVLILENRPHIGGNCYDYIDPQTGIRVNKYGAHLFHTNSKRVWDYVHLFSEWTDYEHRVLGHVDGKNVPIPVNIDTVNQLFNLNIENSDEMDRWLKEEQVTYDHDPVNSEEMALSRVGKRLYELIFKGYTFKQWAKYPAELGPEVTSRIPVRNDRDDRYFPNDVYQALPSGGYTNMFENMILNRAGIDVFTNTDYFDVKDDVQCGQTWVLCLCVMVLSIALYCLFLIRSWSQFIFRHDAQLNFVFFRDLDWFSFYTGPIDTYYTATGWPKLEYRSLDFEQKVALNTQYFQPISVVNYPSSETNFTRIVEYKHLLDQKSPHTIYFIERSKDGGEPYYPVPTKRNKDLYKKYQAMAEKEPGVHFVGRLANYKYFNMDQAILNALEVFDTSSAEFDSQWTACNTLILIYVMSIHSPPDDVFHIAHLPNKKLILELSTRLARRHNGMS